MDDNKGLTVAIYRGSELLASGEIFLTGKDGAPLEIEGISRMKLESDGANVTASIALKVGGNSAK